MPFAGFELNPKHTDPWVIAIGKFMVNFGGVEWTTFLWIDRLSNDPLLKAQPAKPQPEGPKELTLEMPLARRIGVIRRLLESRQPGKKLLNEARSAWGKAEKLAQLRNDIAHNPIVFGWHGPEEKRTPDFIGSLNFRKVKSGAHTITPLLEFWALNRGIDEAAAIAQKLHELLESVAPVPSET